MNENRTPVPKWLQALMENSWELELLISGGAVFTLIQTPELFLSWMRKLELTNSLGIIWILTILGTISLKILTNGFILHIILRSFWLALVCINYVYPQGINGTRISLKYPFQTSHKEGDLQNQIMNVDKLSGLVIFMSILGTILFSGIVLLVFAFILVGDIGDKYLNLSILKIGYYCSLITFLLYIFDLVTMGFFRKIPYFTFLIFPFFFIYDLITLRPFYARAIFLFSSNVGRWQFRMGALVFTIITGATSYNSFSSNLQYDSFIDQRKHIEKLSKNQPIFDLCYADQISQDYYPTVFIPSLIIENNFLRVGVTYKKWMDNLGTGYRNDSIDYLDQCFNVTVDDSLYQNLVWREFKRRDITNSGIECVVDISHLKNGFHSLKVKPKNISEEHLNAIFGWRKEFPDIPFWKDVY